MERQIGSNPWSVALVDGLNVQRVLSGKKTLADAGVSLFDIPMPAGASFGAILFWSVEASDGTDTQNFTGVTTLSSVNKAGSFTDVITTLATMQAKAVSAGTLTISVGITDGTNKITITFTPTGSLTETFYQLNYTLLNLSEQPASVL